MFIPDISLSEQLFFVGFVKFEAKQDQFCVCWVSLKCRLKMLEYFEVLKMLREAAVQGQHFKVWGHNFSLYGPTLSR